VKKVVFLVFVLLLLTGCQNTSNSASSAVQSQNTNESTPTITQAQNTVVQSPKINEVTYEISEKLVGKYVVKDDPEMYFEIKPDGRAEIALNIMEGYAKYSVEDIQLTLFYNDETYRDHSGMDMSEAAINSAIKTITINFNLISGEWRYPPSCGLSLCLEGDLKRDDDGNMYCKTFVLRNYLPDFKFTFVKQE